MQEAILSNRDKAASFLGFIKIAGSLRHVALSCLWPDEASLPSDVILGNPKIVTISYGCSLGTAGEFCDGCYRKIEERTRIPTRKSLDE